MNVKFYDDLKNGYNEEINKDELIDLLHKKLEAYENMRLKINSYICNNSQYDENIDDCWVRTNELIEIIDKVGGSDE